MEDFCMDINYNAIGGKIRFWRKDRHMSQEQLAILVEREPGYICRIERSKQTPSLDTLLRICYALNLDINHLLPDSPKSQSYAHFSEMGFIFDGCNSYEKDIIIQNAAALKDILVNARKKPNL